MAKASLKTTQTDALRILLIQRGMSIESLAAQCGMKTITVSNQIAKNFPSRRLRYLVEDALNAPIWSALADFESRRNLVAACGFNPFTATIPDLRRKATAFKLRGRSRKGKAGLIGLLENYFAECARHETALRIRQGADPEPIAAPQPNLENPQPKIAKTT